MTLGASVLASLPLLSAAAPAEANNADRLNARLNDMHERREAMQQLRFDAQQSHQNGRRSDTPKVFNTPDVARTAATLGISSSSVLNDLRSGRGRSDRAIIYPGQVSEFRTARPRTTYINHAGNSRLVTRGVELDLSSTSANITVGRNVIDGSATINVGGESKTISAGDRVTAAEFAALNQVLATGSQSLTLTDGGAAESGDLNLNLLSDDGATMRASQLVVPTNVTVTGDFARTADGVRVTKDVVNFGSIIATSSNANRNTAVIGARSIENEQGGLIASQASASNPELNLTLKAERNLSNQGSITAAGALEIDAPLVVNRGTMSSATSDVTFTTGENQLLVDNQTGTVSADNGAINIRTADYSGYAGSTVYGGDFNSRDFNLNAGQASADVFADTISGTVNSSGLAAHVRTNMDTLVIGNQCLTGDPTYFNTGNIIIGGNIVVGEALAIIAGGSITTNQTALSIVARDAGTQGYDINIIAGAFITGGTGQIAPSGGPATLPTQSLVSITQNATAPVTIDPNGITGGGNIDLTFATSVVIDSRSLGTNQAGGNITLAAFSGMGGFGQVNLGAASQILSSGNGTGSNGSVTILAGASSGQSVNVGTIDNNDAFAPGTAGGFVKIVNAQPTSSDGMPITFATTGNITSGNFLTNGVTPVIGSVTVGNISTYGRRVDIVTGGNLQAGNINTTRVGGGTAGDVVLEGGLNGNFSFTSINASGVGNGGNGGTVFVTAGNGVTYDLGPINAGGETGGLGGNGGNITITANRSSMMTWNPFEQYSVTAGQVGFAGELRIHNTGSGGISLDSLNFNIEAELGGNQGLMEIDAGTGPIVRALTGISINANPFFSSNLNASFIFTGASMSVNGIFDIQSYGGAEGTGQISITTTTGAFTSTGLGLVSGGDINLNFAQPYVPSSFSNILFESYRDINAANTSFDMTGVATPSFSATARGSVALGNITVNKLAQTAGVISITAGTGFQAGNISTGNISAVGNAGTGLISLSADGDITIPMLNTTGNLNLSLNGTGTIMGNSNFVSGVLNASGSGELQFNSHFSALNLGQISGSLDTFLYTTDTVGGITTTNTINTTGDLSIFTPKFTNAQSITANTVIVQNLSGGLNVVGPGSGTITATVPANGAPGSPNSPAITFRTASGTNLVIDGTMNFGAGGDVLFETPNGTITSNNGSLYAAANNLTLNTTSWVQVGTGNITANNLILSGTGRTIANIGGDVNLSSNLTFNGTDLAIISSGNVNLNNITINLSSGTIAGGNLSIIAGFNFTPTTSGQIETSSALETFTLTTGSSGSVTGTATIITSSIADDGGSVQVYANGGSVSLGGITTDSATGDAGSVAITASQGVTTDAISAVGATNTNTLVQVRAADPIPAGAITVTAGTVTGGFTLTATSGNVSTGAINAGLGAVAVTSGSGDLTVSGAIAGNQGVAVVTTGSGTISTGAIAAGSGSVEIEAEDGNITVGAVSFNQNSTITSNDGNVSTGAINGGAGSITITTDAGDISTAAVDVSSNSLTFESVSGDIQVTGLIETSTGTNITTGQDGAVTISDVLATGSVSVSTLDGDINIGGTLNSNALTSITSTSGDITTTALNASAGELIVTTGSGNIQVNGSIDGTGVTLQTSGSGTILASTVDGQTGSVLIESEDGNILIGGPISGTDVEISTEALLTLNNLSVTAAGGGSIDISANTLTASNLQLTAPSSSTTRGRVSIETVSGDLTFAAAGGLMIDVSGPGPGGIVDISTGGNITVGSVGIDAAGLDGDGAIIRLDANSGSLVLLAQTAFLLAANATGTDANGGEIYLEGNDIALVSSPDARVQLSANGTGTGSGGSITYINRSAASTVLGTVAKAPKGTVNYLDISATNGSDIDQASVYVETGGNITVGTDGLDISLSGTNTLGANVVLSAGNVSGKAGSLVVLGDIDARGLGSGTGGVIELYSANKKAFTIGSGKAPKNGVQGVVQTNGQSITIENDLGGITISTDNAVQSPELILSAGGKGAIATGKEVSIEAFDRLVLSSQQGAVGKKPLIVTTELLQINTEGGDANVLNLSFSPLSLEVEMDGGDLHIETARTLNVAGNVQTGDGDITLISSTGLTGGSLNVLAGQIVRATNGSLTLANLDTTIGEINIGDGAEVRTAGNGGNVVIAIGEPPKKGINPDDGSNTPAGITTFTEGKKGQIFYGPTGAFPVVSSGTANVNAINKAVIFNNATTDPLNRMITIGNGAVIEADPPARVPSGAVRVNTLPTLPTMTLNTTATPSVETFSVPALTLDGINNLNVANTRLTSSEISSLGTTGDISSLATTSDISSMNTTSGISENSGDLFISAAYLGDEDADQNEFAVERVGSVQLNAHASSEHDKYTLRRGSVVFAPTADKTIETLHGTVKMKAGAIAIVTQSTNGLSVYDLHDSKRNSVVVEVNDKALRLSPGQHVTVSGAAFSGADARDYASVNPIELVQHRGLSHTKLDNGLSLYTSEFSIPSACYAVKPLQRLMQSKHPEASAIAKRVFKTSAVLMTLNPDRGDFVQHFKSQVAAMAR